MTDSPTPAVATRRAAFLAAGAAPAGARVPVELRPTVRDPFDAYRRARAVADDGFFSETTGGQSGWGYFGIDPVERTHRRAVMGARRRDTSPRRRAVPPRERPHRERRAHRGELRRGLRGRR